VFEIQNFKKGATIIQLKAEVTELNIRGILMFHCGRNKNTECTRGADKSLAL
jgi:hypothetical protein